MAQPGVPGWGAGQGPHGQAQVGTSPGGCRTASARPSSVLLQQGGTSSSCEQGHGSGQRDMGVPGGESLSAITCVSAVTSALLLPLLRACKE